MYPNRLSTLHRNSNIHPLSAWYSCKIPQKMIHPSLIIICWIVRLPTNQISKWPYNKGGLSGREQYISILLSCSGGFFQLFNWFQLFFCEICFRNFQDNQDRP
jgi:hypothetical protein